MPTDWQELSLTSTAAPAVVDPRRRLRWCLGAFVVASGRRLVPRGAVGNQPRGGVPRRGPAAQPPRKTSAGGAGQDSGPRRHGAGLRSGSGGRGGRVSLPGGAAAAGLAGTTGPQAAAERPASQRGPAGRGSAEAAARARATAPPPGRAVRHRSSPVAGPGTQSPEPRRADRGRRPAAADRSRPFGPAAARRCVVGRSVLRSLARDLRARPRRRAGDRHRGRRTGRPCPGGRRSRGGGCGDSAARRALSRHADRRPDPPDVSCRLVGGARAWVSRDRSTLRVHGRIEQVSVARASSNNARPCFAGSPGSRRSDRSRRPRAAGLP